MQENSVTGRTAPPSAADRLDSWKEIASYLRRGERTVRRWEETEALPVHRHQHGSRSTVYAIPAELDAWLASRGAAGLAGSESGSGRQAAPAPVRRPIIQARAGIAIAAALTILAALLVMRGGAIGELATPFAQPIPLTAVEGEESAPSFSPDGRAVVFLWRQAGRARDVYTKSLDSEAVRQITDTPEQELSPAFSPDGTTIAFLRVSGDRAAVVLHTLADGRERTVEEVAAPEQVFHGNPGPFLAWLPDSRRLIVTDRIPAGGPTALYVHDLRDGRTQQLTDPPPDTIGDNDPAVSPDGSTLVFVRNLNNAVCDLYRLSLTDDRKPAPELLVANKRWNHSPTWTPDGRSVLFSSGFWGHVRLWQMSVHPLREPEPVAGFGEDGFLATVSSRGDVAYMRYYPRVDVWRIELSAPGKAAGPPAPFITSSRLDGTPRSSPDGKSLLFSSHRSGSQELWTADVDGTNVRRLTHFGGPPAGSASWSPDGTEIVFDWLADGQQDVFVMSVATRDIRRVTDHPGPDITPSWSSDGRAIYFVSRRSGRDEVWKVPAGGGPAAQITHRGGFFPQESADGEYVYYIRADVPATSLLRIPVAGGEETEVIRSVARRRYKVTRDGIYFQPADADQPVFGYLNFQVGESVPFATAISFPTGSPISVSPDERWLYFMVPAAPQADLMLARRAPEHDLTGGRVTGPRRIQGLLGASAPEARVSPKQ